MRVLLDECVPRKLRREITAESIKWYERWAGTKNGELLRWAATQFDVLLTTERETAYLLKSETMKKRFLEAKNRTGGISLDNARTQLGI